jgi:hypothetical protein
VKESVSVVRKDAYNARSLQVKDCFVQLGDSLSLDSALKATQAVHACVSAVPDQALDVQQPIRQATKLLNAASFVATSNADKRASVSFFTSPVRHRDGGVPVVRGCSRATGVFNGTRKEIKTHK